MARHVLRAPGIRFGNRGSEVVGAPLIARRASVPLLALSALAFVACSSSEDPSDGFSPVTDAAAPTADAANTNGADAGADPGPGLGELDGSTPARCEPPDMLVVLDRSLSMHKRPDGTTPTNDPPGRQSSKWGEAVRSIRQLASAPRDTSIRFGLELFPRDPGEGKCIRLSDRLNGQTTSNTTCEPGEVVVPVQLSAGAEIASKLTVNNTPLCLSTPTTAGIQVASQELARVRDGKREQFIVLVTDGAETCGTNALRPVQTLAGAGIRTFVIGFGANPDGGADAVDEEALNDLACAGKTAKDAANNCVPGDGGSGFVAKNRKGAALYLRAGSGAELTKALEDVAGEVCCNCVK
jgi:hypothetical protein